jgi:hypothetical protein
VDGFLECFWNAPPAVWLENTGSIHIRGAYFTGVSMQLLQMAFDFAHRRVSKQGKGP